MGSFENEALENEDRSTQNSKMKHPKLENGAPKTQKRGTQNSKMKHPKLETCLSFNPLSPNNDQHQFSPNDINTLS